MLAKLLAKCTEPCTLSVQSRGLHLRLVISSHKHRMGTIGLEQRPPDREGLALATILRWIEVDVGSGLLASSSAKGKRCLQSNSSLTMSFYPRKQVPTPLVRSSQQTDPLHILSTFADEKPDLRGAAQIPSL